MSDTMDKGPGRGRGRWSAKGVQAAQADDIEGLKALVEQMGARLDAIEAGEPVQDDGTEPPDPGTEEPPAEGTGNGDEGDSGGGAV